MARYYFEYLTSVDFPAAFPWNEQPKRWQRMMCIIAPIYRLYKDMAEAHARKRPPL